jgi:hypothetical protein
MSILWIGGFDFCLNPWPDLKNFGGNGSGSTNGRYNGLAMSLSSTMYAGPQFANTTTIISCFCLQNTQNSPGLDLCALLDSNVSNVQLKLYLTSNNTIQLRKYDNTILATGTMILRPTNWYWMVWSVTIGIAGSSSLTIDGVLDHNISGVLTQQTINSYANWLIFKGPGFSGGSTNIDDCFILDTIGSSPWNAPLSDKHIFTSFPISDTATGWTPDQGVYHFIRVNDIFNDSIPDASYIRTNIPNSIDNFGIQPNPKNYEPLIVQTNYMARKDSDGNRVIQLLLNGITDSTYTLINVYQDYQKIYYTEPYSGSPWSQNLANAMQPGVELIS